MNKTAISWTQMSWNPTTGCSKVSAGCKNCYAEKIALELQARGKRSYSNGFELTLQPYRLNQPRELTEPTLIFANSMSDLFHEAIRLEYIQAAFKVMNKCPQHTFQILTKRSGNLLKYAPELVWSDNIWMGVTVENDEVLYRIDDLRKVPAKIKWLSLEPLLCPLPNLNLNEIEWGVVGGEHADDFRPMDIAWVRDIRDQCLAQNVPFFFKQYAAQYPKSLGDYLDGRQWHEYPMGTMVAG